MQSRLHPFARPIGYALVLGVLVFLGFAAAFFYREAFHARRAIRVHFPEIATLAEGDPVVQGGVPVGAVRRIRLPPAGSANREALVEIELFHDRFLARDARFINFSHSLMGARKVWIAPGSSPLPLDETETQEGLFAPGLAETLHRVDSLVTILSRLRAETERLLAEDNPLLSPLAAARALDRATKNLGELSGKLAGAQSALQTGLRDFSSAAKGMDQGVRAAEPPLRSALLRVAGLVEAVESVQKNLDSLLTRLEKAAAVAGDSTGMGGLLNDARAYENLEKSVRVLETATNLLQKDGLTDSVKIRPRLRAR